MSLARADVYPYLGHANLFPRQPDGVLQREYGYERGDLLYLHRKPERIAFAGDRFERIFRLPPDQVMDASAFRIFVVDMAGNRRFIETNPEYRAASMDSSLSIYLQNLRTIVDICAGQGIPVVLAPQPAPDLLLKRHGERIRAADPARYARIIQRIESLPTSAYRSPPFIVEAYEKMLAAIVRAPQLAPHFADVQEAVDLDRFVGFVHIDAAGQAELADALAAAVRKRLPAAWSPAMRDKRNPPRP